MLAMKNFFGLGVLFGWFSCSITLHDYFNE